MPTPTPENNNAPASRTDKAVVCDALVLVPWVEGWWWARYCADWRNRDPWTPVDVQRHHRTGKLEVRWQGDLTFSPMPDRDWQWAPMSQPPPVDWQNDGDEGRTPADSALPFRMKTKHRAKSEGRQVRSSSGALVSQFAKLVEEILQHQIANRDTSSAFYKCYTYNIGNMPAWVAKAERLLANVPGQERRGQ